MMKSEENIKENTISGSRLRKDVSNIFDCFLIVNRPNKLLKDVEPEYKYPKTFSDKEILQQSYLFCFPFDCTSKTVSQFKNCGSHFTFILTDIEGKHRFGFCKLTNETQKCYCILSFLPWFEIFYKILNYIHELSLKSNEETMEIMLIELHQQPMPVPNEKIQISTTLSFSAPDLDSLPSIPENRNLSEYFAAVNSSFMMEVFANLMFERRIVFTSKSLSVLTSCIHSAEALLNPLHWQHIFIPVMPSHLLDYCLAPMPYLVGVHKSLMPKVREMISMDQDIILADIDQAEIETVHHDIERLPNDTVSILKSHLRKQNVAMGTDLAMSFLHAQARLIGGYRNGLKFSPGEPISFDEEKFIDSYRSATTKEFARALVQLQTFKQFVDCRLEMLNGGIGFRDDFENQVNVLDAAGGFEKDTYKEWLNAAKKGGNKLITQIQRKAKDNMKVAQVSVRNYWKNQQLKQQSSINRKKSLEETTKRIRPSRPPPLETIKPAENRLTKPRPTPPPRPPPPSNRPVVPLRKKKSVRRTRHYTEIDLDYVASTSASDDEPPPREKSKSIISYQTLDLDLLTDMQQVMDDKITKLSTPTKEARTDLLVDVTSHSDEVDDTTVDKHGLNEKRESVIRRRALVKSRPHSIKAKTKEQYYSSDDLSSIEDKTRLEPPQLIPPAEPPQLIDLSLPDPQSSTAPSPRVQPSATDDLLGLDFSMSSQQLKLDVENPNWNAFESPGGNNFQSNNVSNPFAASPSHTESGHKGSPSFPSSSAPYVAGSNPFATGLLPSESSKSPSPGNTPMKLNEDKFHPHSLARPSAIDPFANYSLHRTASMTHSAGANSTTCSPQRGANRLPLQRSQSIQSLPRHKNPFISNRYLLNATMSSGTGRPMYREKTSPKMDSELFSDLLGSWKAREG